jgi:hypothetical protein
LRGQSTILIIGPVAFKQNLPVVAGLGLLAAGLLSLAIYFRKPEEALLREAAAAHAATLGQAKDVVLHGSLVDLEFHNRPTVYAEFLKQDGRWVFSKDLGAEFEKSMKEPATWEAILKRLAQRVADRFALEAKIANPEFTYQYLVSRESGDLAGQMFVFFNYPPQNGQQRHGCYREVFRYVEGAWKSDGTGALFDRVAPPRK